MIRPRWTRSGWLLLLCLSILVPVAIVGAQATPSFGGRTDYTVGSWPTQVCSADFNGDSWPDLAVCNYSSSTISILTNNGDGTFQTSATHNVGGGPNGISTADLDGDGDYDLVFGNAETNNISVMLNTGAGSFAPPATYPVCSWPHLPYIADLDGDNDIDIAVPSYTAGRVYILLNNGNGTFSAGGDYATGSGLCSVYAGDFDGDSDNDLAATNAFSNTVSILLNNGNGTYQPAVDYITGSEPHLVYGADFDGDTHIDLAVANRGSSTVSIFRNNGNAVFSLLADYPVGSLPRDVASADLDGDEDYDLAVSAYGESNVTILINDGTGTFQSGGVYALGSSGSSPRGICVADLDKDGDKDLVFGYTSGDYITILFNTTPQPCGDIGFRPNPDGWQFANTKANMWPYIWTPLDPIDEICWCGLNPFERCFPSWELFKEAFGPAQTMLSGYTKPSARKKWQSIRRCFGGSCFGFAVSGFLFFDGLLDLNTVIPGYTNLYSVPLNDNSRKLVNKYSLYQYGQVQQEHINSYKETTTPNQTLWACQYLFNAAIRDDRVLAMYSNNPAYPGAHAVNPYRCEQEETNPDMWYIYVYDNNYPGDQTMRITIDVSANSGNGDWFYPGQPGWGGANYLFLMDPLTDYSTTPILPTAMAPRENWIGTQKQTTYQTSGEIDFYFGDADSVQFQSSSGVVGVVNDSLFGSVTGAHPVIPITGQVASPIGFHLPQGDWSCRFAGKTDSSFYLTIFGNGTVLDYRPHQASGFGSLNLRCPNDSVLIVRNEHSVVHKYDLTSISVSPDSEIAFSIMGVQSSPNDSVRHAVTVQGGADISNYGGPSSYTIRIEILGNGGDTVFYSEGVSLPANSMQRILPDWRSRHDSLMIMVDSGMVGTFSDTVYVPNAGEIHVCGDANGSGTVNISDAVYLIAYIFSGGPAPSPLLAGDANCSGTVNISDAVYLIAYIFSGGPAPCAGCK